MTVKELIEELKKFPPEAIVQVPDPALEWSDASMVHISDAAGNRGRVLIFPAQ